MDPQRATYGTVAVNALLAVFIGGGAGSVLRYWIGLKLNVVQGLPWGTWLVNAVGCLLAGMLFTALDLGRPAAASTRALLLVGLCGGFTTFSAFALELWLLAPQRPRMALLYLLVTLLVTLLACGLGLWTGRLLRNG